MKKNNQPIGFSYYGLSLLSFLQSSHPDRATDTDFIKVRAELACQTFSDALLAGYTQAEAIEQANEVLYGGLHFSKYDTIVNILWNEFAHEVPQGSAKELAIRLQPLLEPTFRNYPLTDDFAYTAEFDMLYTEITGEVLIWLEENEL